MSRSIKVDGAGMVAHRVRVYARSERGRAELECLLGLCRASAEAQGAIDVFEHGDVGRLFFGPANRALGALLEAAEQGKVDRVHASHLGAFGGEPDDVQAVVGRLLKAGVVVETLRDGRLSAEVAYLLAFGDLKEPQTPKARSTSAGRRRKGTSPR